MSSLYAAAPMQLPENTDKPNTSAIDLIQLLGALKSAGSADRVAIGELVDALGPSGPNGVLLLVALLAFSPATLILGVATICGCTIAVVSAQRLFGSTSLWIPAPIRRFQVRRTAVFWIAERLENPLAWLQHNTRPVMQYMTNGFFGQLSYAISLLLGVATPILELVPLSATSAGAAVSFTALGLLLQDGRIVLFGMLLSVCVIAVVSVIGCSAIGLLVCT